MAYYQAQGPAMTAAAAERDVGGGGGIRAPPGSLQPPPRRGQIKEKIIKDVAAAFASVAASFVRSDKNADGDK